GAMITYTYSGGSNGLDCVSGMIPVLTKQTPDGTWTYTRSGATVTVTDPAGNDTVVTFDNSGAVHEVQKTIYQGPASSNVVLQTALTCYNGNFTSCATAQAPVSILRKDVYTYPGTMSTQPALSETTYTNTGLLTGEKLYDFGATLPPGTNFI